MNVYMKGFLLAVTLFFVITLSACNTAHYDMGVSQEVLTVVDVEVSAENNLIVYLDNTRTRVQPLENLIDADIDPLRAIEVKLGETHIEWRYDDEATWQNLVELEEYEAESSGYGWMQWIVARIAELIVYVSFLAGGHYVVGLVVITVLIRILGWPIYSKSNALSSNMQMAQPALDKLKQKYQGKTDQQSQRMQQQEMMAIYKEYGINPFGCLLPLLQMPIFIAMYQTVRRIPLTTRYLDEGLNFNFLWFNFRDEPVSPFYHPENFTFLLLAGIVGVTMFFYQKYVMKKPEQLQNKKYRTDQQIQQEKTMKYMTYFMTFMLVFIAFTNLGIAFYWIIGNLFQFFQTYINRKQTIKRLELKKNTI